MADDVLITKQQTLEAAIPEALRLCRNSPKSVLVHIAEDSLLREENARLRAALKPFADRLDELEKMKASKYACATSVEIEHLRTAAAAIREGGKDE